MSKLPQETAALHPLHSAQFVADFVLNRNRLPGSRCTGRTTALALEHIVKAMRNPGVEITLLDHYHSTAANRAIRDTVEQVLSKLDFSHFRVKHSSTSIGCWTLVFGEVE